MVAHADPVTKQLNGIICDMCNKTCIDKFEYYSGHFDLVEVDRAIGKTGIKRVDRRYVDVDICVECMEKFKQKMLEMIKKREEKGKWEAKNG